MTSESTLNLPAVTPSQCSHPLYHLIIQSGKLNCRYCGAVNLPKITATFNPKEWENHLPTESLLTALLVEYGYELREYEEDPGINEIHISASFGDRSSLEIVVSPMATKVLDHGIPNESGPVQLTNFDRHEDWLVNFVAALAAE